MLMITPEPATLESDVILAAAKQAARAIPPLWPLTSSVAVNPFLGQTEEPLAIAAVRLRRAAGIALTMSRAWYADRIHTGEISDEDIEGALGAARELAPTETLASVKSKAEEQTPALPPLPTIADFAAKASSIDWPGILSERFGHWAASYFDAGHALWAAPQSRSAYAAWRAVATNDLTPEILGLSGFAAHIAQAPEHQNDVVIQVVKRLGLSEGALEMYFHRLLLSLGGWAQYARYRLWKAELSGSSDDTIAELLAIRMMWESALFEQYGSKIADQWEEALCAYASSIEPTLDDAINMILQEATERSLQRRLAKTLAVPALTNVSSRPAMQMAFCIDVRSEVFRRALESTDPCIETLGFAGFFGLGISHKRFASDVPEAHLPVLLYPKIHTCSGGHSHDNGNRDQTARVVARAKRAWGRFKLAAISSFAFVEATGPIYASKLIHDGLGLSKNEVPNDPPPRFDPALPLDARISIAESVLKAMCLIERFAPLILVAGHGANVINNPHASALHCGACGGYSGDVNARLLAGLLNDPEVRLGLVERGINIPDDTLFVGALHDTTTDRVTVYEADHPSSTHREKIVTAKAWLKVAGQQARTERALRLPRATGPNEIVSRSRDWSEIRPEWGLAGCDAFIAAPRRQTVGRDLKGRVFLHDYDWRLDEEFSILELIMTAPVVVASWISLQYYGSTVAPELFGGGNKLLHNVTGGIGVLEGNGGLLRAGLPWQSVHDGKHYVHDPVRLTVLLEAPRDAMSAILKRHDQVRALFDNKWLHLIALDDNGFMAWRYIGGLRWQAIATNKDERHPMAV
ncbi:YbcC family protein [Afipia felis]|uniref:Probable inorganic carbon transporter subunit DabA n=2 Tax=Afipia felis TaxID=1035 RepID=A0A380WCM5_AFIFE|nr:DUF2309 domain-containing protein [Afipia felis]EKS29900.1 hypothetical protein HMPREF9697_02428 [Afipia felis ATCC 53690]SUU78607.1 Uncharacterized protein conserved in bacteria [Afipia felis]SUU86672.1 Uncharacterized protein conserved in bacteria [Afipia felis]